MMKSLFWIEDGKALPVNKVECCTDGSVRLVWVEIAGESRLRDVWKNDGTLWLKRHSDESMPKEGPRSSDTSAPSSSVCPYHIGAHYEPDALVPSSHRCSLQVGHGSHHVCGKCGFKWEDSAPLPQPYQRRFLKETPPLTTYKGRRTDMPNTNPEGGMKDDNGIRLSTLIRELDYILQEHGDMAVLGSEVVGDGCPVIEVRCDVNDYKEIPDKKATFLFH